ncbi:uncharacterized protein FPRO_15842 [Fusarium proliferatum ET1]|uniref:Uncharacterized protein n=1 Tax=Fusarium proliferatum (strain ET1) TaxID=1227346 RepID=A0A1L7WA39_FUSPR|nr:uncharacterized protein FPRO_15842 [Fusarium proliferatum ET1]CZR49482.1 uncharacterized protein FPRO_15842 [Fusarium proliferatum ET1]
MAEHVKLSPDSSQPRAPSLDKSPTVSRKVSPTETPLPSPPDSLGRDRPAAAALPKVLVEALHELEEARPREEDYHKTFPLSWAEFKSAKEEIEATFRRFDYDPFKGEITIRMPSSVHEGFAGSFNTAVLAKLWPLMDGDNATAKFVAGIRQMLSTDIIPNTQRRPDDPDDDVDKKKQKSPDPQYRHVKSGESGVVVEVAYSQQGKKLKNLAKGYIGGSKGAIRAKARLTPKPTGHGSILEVEQAINAVPFRDAHKQPVNSDHELVLTLHDLAAKEGLLVDVDDLPIAFRYDELCGIVNEMEEFLENKLHKQRLQDAGENEGDSIELRISSSSSIEQLSTDSEKEEPQKKGRKGETGFYRTVKGIQDRPNVTTRSGLGPKRPAPANTGENLPVPKRRSKRRRN